MAAWLMPLSSATVAAFAALPEALTFFATLFFAAGPAFLAVTFLLAAEGIGVDFFVAFFLSRCPFRGDFLRCNFPRRLLCRIRLVGYSRRFTRRFGRDLSNGRCTLLLNQEFGAISDVRTSCWRASFPLNGESMRKTNLKHDANPAT